MRKLLILPVLVLLCAFSAELTPQVFNNNGKNIEYISVRHEGAPTIVFENGLGVKMDEWKKVLPLVAQKYSIYAYNRPSYGRSDLTEAPRDAATIVNELRVNLTTQGFSPPYIYVGHSLGGLYAQYYARKYPQELKGAILVDSTHPLQFTGDGAYENWPNYVRFIFESLLSETGEKELFTSIEAGQQVLAEPTPNINMIIMLAQKPMRDRSKLGIDAANKRLDMERLYPNAKIMWVNSGHMIPSEEPETIINAIDEIANK